MEATTPTTPIRHLTTILTISIHQVVWNLINFDCETNKLGLNSTSISIFMLNFGGGQLDIEDSASRGCRLLN